MRIASIILKHFIPFTDSGIREIHVTFTEKVQIIIGSNGAGKTVFMEQLSAYPPARTIFTDKKGFKSSTYVKEGIYYRLESEFEKPSSPHLFFEGNSDDNINIGRTTQTQEELIVEHLGITPLVNDLIMNKLTFPAMSTAKRKEFLMGVNPDNIGFVLPLIKQQASKIKACRNNLSRLSERKILLEQQLLDTDTLQAVITEKDHIEQDLGNFQKLLMDIEIGVRTIGPHETVRNLDLSATRSIVNQSRYRLSTLSHIPRDDQDRQRHKETTLSRIAVCEQQLIEKEEAIGEHLTTLNDLETRYREIGVDEDLQQIDNTIARLELERDRLDIIRPSFELSKEELDKRYRELDEVSERLLIFTNLTSPLLTTKRRQHRERMLQTSQYKQSSWKMRLGDYETQLDNLSRRHNMKPSDIPNSPCAKDACPLYSHFMGEYTTTETKRQSLQRSIDKGQRKIARMDHYVGALLEYFEQSKPFVEQIQWLLTYAQTNPVLHHQLRQLDIRHILSTNPNLIVRQLQEAYERIEQWLKLKSVLADLEIAQALKQRQISTESQDTIQLITGINQHKATIVTLRENVQELIVRKARLTKYLDDLNQFTDIKTMIMDLLDQHRSLMQALANGYEKECLVSLRKGLEELRTRHFLRMSDIEKTIRAQASLKERYQEEIVGQIQLIEKELADLLQMEKALIAIPTENMIGFINTVFKQANKFIDLVWMVPLQIDLLKKDDPLTYEFQVSGDNQSTREISKCSEGQTEIISTAINLALRVVLGHFDFPLCLDEPARTFDEKHRHNYVLLLKRLLDDNVISQLFIVSHHSVMHEGFPHSETMVVREDNVLLPAIYNEHVSIN